MAKCTGSPRSMKDEPILGIRHDRCSKKILMYLVNMPSLHDQLKEIEEKKKDLEPKYSRFSKLDDIENFYLAGLLLSITVVVLIFIFIYRLFPGLKENGLFALFTLYGGGFAIALLHEVLPQTLRFVAQKVFKFDKEEYSRIESFP